MNKQKKIIIIAAVGVVVVIASIFFLKKDAAPKIIYDVAVMVRDQNNSDSEEDRKTSLKKGDVLVVQNEDHNWSKTESISYLILRMEITEEQSQMLTRAKTREVTYEEMTEEQRGRIDEEKKRAEAEGSEYTPEKVEEIIIAREYGIDMSNFEGFKAEDLILKQPYRGMVYGWEIVAKKK